LAICGILNMSERTGKETQMATIDTRDADRLSRKWAAEVKDWKGTKGGWIAANAGTGRVICQGWGSVWHQNKTAILDWLTAKHTAFSSFAEMTDATSETYCPTLLARGREKADVMALADAFDSRMAEKRSHRRAYRGVGYERYVVVRAEVWYGGWTIRDTATAKDLDYHSGAEAEARKEAEACNWRRAHGYRIGYGAEQLIEAAA
jgi:hypothetical protein